MSSVVCFNLDRSKILSSGKGLTLYAEKELFENILGKGDNTGGPVCLERENVPLELQ